MGKSNPFDKLPSGVSPFKRLSNKALDKTLKGCAHVFGKGYRCSTDEIGYSTPKNKGPADLVLDASEGFIPFWAKDVTLRWRFNEVSFRQFSDSTAAKAAIRSLMGKALLLWEDAVPIKFTEAADAWDFEVNVKAGDDCNISGCTLASAYFPDQGRHQLFIYPKSFEQSEAEQIDTLAHEFGHVFGLRHFFAKIAEKEWASVIFGKHRPFSIMNYGDKSTMTKQDRKDLKTLYAKVWSKELTEINGTKIRLVRPYHTT